MDVAGNRRFTIDSLGIWDSWLFLMVWYFCGPSSRSTCPDSCALDLAADLVWVSSVSHGRDLVETS